MEPLGIGIIVSGIVSAIASVIGGITNAIGTSKTNQQQIDLQNQSWDRQSIPYRMAELEKAGLNKQLATGMNPNYGVSARLQTPDFGSAIALGPGKILDTLNAVAHSESVMQQTKNAKQAYAIGETNKLIAEETLAQEREKTRLLQHDIDIKVKRPYASDEPSSFGFNPRTLSGVLDMLGIGTGDQSSIGSLSSGGFVPTFIQVLLRALQHKAVNVQNKEKRKERVSEAWRSDSNSQASIKYSHGYGGQ